MREALTPVDRPVAVVTGGGTGFGAAALVGRRKEKLAPVPPGLVF